MRIVKDPEERKNEILKAAARLFTEKGFEETSINDITDEVGVARGTVYYYFKSKEEIMETLIDRMGSQMISAAKVIADDKSIPVIERLLKTILSINASGSDESILEHIHKPQNALMHQKTHRIMLESVTPVLASIIEDGIKEKIFDTPYPYESVETVIAHNIIVFDGGYMDILPPEERIKKMKAFVFNLDRIFGAEPGSFAPILGLDKQRAL